MNTSNLLPPILVADDSETDVFFLRRRLVAAGILNRVVHVEDGLQAVRWIENNVLRPGPETRSPRLVFLDLCMPNMDGFEVLGWLKRNALTAQLTTVVLTSSDDPVDLHTTQLLGAQHYLVKYPAPADLARIAAALDGKGPSPSQPALPEGSI